MLNVIIALLISIAELLALLFIKRKYMNDLAPNNRIMLWCQIIVCSVCCVLFNFLVISCTYMDILEKINLCIAHVVILIVAYIDLNKHIIPNKIIICGLVLRIILLIVEGIFKRDTIVDSIITSVVGFVVSLIVMLIISFISKHGIGYGDVKLYAYLGFVIGLIDVYYVLFYSALFAAVYAGYLVIAKKADRKYRIPFGPSVYLAFALVYIMMFFG